MKNILLSGLMGALGLMAGFVGGLVSVQARDAQPPPELYRSPIIAPYLYDGRSTQNQQLRHETWQVSDWATGRLEARRMIPDFVRLNILADGHVWGHVNGYQYVGVGPGFYRLSAFDRQRVLAVVDLVYGATQKRSATLFVEDDQTGRVIGIYRADGLRLE